MGNRRVPASQRQESERERKEVEDMAAAKRQQAKEEFKNAEEGEKAVNYFRNIAAGGRRAADKIRAL